MLKIREYDDNGNKIDLKELEKHGFKPYYIVGKKHYEIMYNNGNNIKVDPDTRFIHLNFNSVCNKIPNVIYDLIKADLVEKVGDDQCSN